MLKNIFGIFYVLSKKYKIRIKKENAKMSNISHNGQGGCEWKKRGAKSKLTQAQPKSTLSSTSSNLLKKNTRFPCFIQTPDSLIFSKNS